MLGLAVLTHASPFTLGFASLTQPPIHPQTVCGSTNKHPPRVWGAHPGAGSGCRAPPPPPAVQRRAGQGRTRSPLPFPPALQEPAARSGAPRAPGSRPLCPGEPRTARVPPAGRSSRARTRARAAAPEEPLPQPGPRGRARRPRAPRPIRKIGRPASAARGGGGGCC